MKHPINSIIKLIDAPVIVKADDKEWHFDNGAEASAFDYPFDRLDRRHDIVRISLLNGNVVIDLAEEVFKGPFNYYGEQAEI